MTVRLPATVLGEIQTAAAAAYPFEGCGALLGREPRDVVSSLPLPNVEKGKPRVRFEISPSDYLRVEREADERHLALLGFWHSHPDHPAIPSATDRSYAWEGLLTLVVAVTEGVPKEMTAWEVPGPDLPFQPVPIYVFESPA